MANEPSETPKSTIFDQREQKVQCQINIAGDINIENIISFFKGGKNSEQVNKCDVALKFPLLPYMVNRQDQEIAICEKIECYPWQRPLVCLIYGSDDECVDQFVACLKTEPLRRSLKLSALEPIKEMLSLNIPAPSDSSANFHKKLLFNLGKNLGIGQATVDNINQLLIAQNAPYIIRASIKIKNWQQDEQESVANLLKFWDDWPDLAFSQRLIVCICLRYDQINRHRWKFWSRKTLLYQTIKKTLHSMALKENCEILPPLTPVENNDVVSWAHTHIGVDRDPKITKKIDDIYKDWESQKRSDKIPMWNLAEELQCLLAEHEDFLEN